jgi:hypothetical protein
MKQYYIIATSIIGIIAALAAGFYFLQKPESTEQQTNTPTTTENSALPTVVLEALSKALDDEYKAYATYTQILSTFGNTRPFSNITQAETKHITALETIYTTYSLDIPENPYMNQDLLSGLSTVTEACAAGVEAEKANVALYRDNLLPTVSEYPNISATFTQLMNASQNNHLPAFERCAR